MNSHTSSAWGSQNRYIMSVQVTAPQRRVTTSKLLNGNGVIGQTLSKIHIITLWQKTNCLNALLFLPLVLHVGDAQTHVGLTKYPELLDLNCPESSDKIVKILGQKSADPGFYQPLLRTAYENSC